MSEWFEKCKEWLGPSLAAAQHQDAIASWPWLFRKLHKWLRSHKCPACQYWKNDMKQEICCGPRPKHKPMKEGK